PSGWQLISAATGITTIQVSGHGAVVPGSTQGLAVTMSTSGGLKRIVWQDGLEQPADVEIVSVIRTSVGTGSVSLGPCVFARWDGTDGYVCGLRPSGSGGTNLSFMIATMTASGHAVIASMGGGIW